MISDKLTTGSVQEEKLGSSHPISVINISETFLLFAVDVVLSQAAVLCTDAKLWSHGSCCGGHWPALEHPPREGTWRRSAELEVEAAAEVRLRNTFSTKSNKTFMVVMVGVVKWWDGWLAGAVLLLVL